MTCYSLGGITPVIDPSAYVHPSAVLIGDVIVGPACAAISDASFSNRAPTCRTPA